MNFLKRERATLEKFLPSLDARLSEIPLEEREQPGNPGLSILREIEGTALLVPKEHGGKGANPVEAIEIHRAVGARSPSLSIAMTMHNFSVATLCEYLFYGNYTVELLQQIAGGQLLVASGFAEGRTGTSILDPTMKAVPREGGGYTVNGSKKPCSLSNSMHILTASVAVPGANGNGSRRAVAVIPADAIGLDRKPFWNAPVLHGAESEELTLTNVEISDEQLFFPEVETSLDAVEAGGFLWFEVLVAASYLGVASALVERVIVGKRGDANERTQLAIELEGAMASLEGVARAMMTGERGEAILVQSLFVRFAVQQAIERATSRAVELLGGMAFIRSREIAHLLAASRALGFHPPSRLSVAPALDGYLAGQPMVVA
ncbi:MAG TPA: acyl-CoA dehydrogenase family protein [Thermoanaerobaculia bacterium]|nr:acyl-CoA dehydrogenase family protein [Thermoanaerobaculia bacterium]